MTDNTMREALLKFGDENPSLDLDFRLHTHGKYLTQEKAIVASRAFKAGAAWQAARTVPDGFVVVPVELLQLIQCDVENSADWLSSATSALRNLLSAAPEPKS